MKMPFGKHSGKELRDIPQDYLAWVLDKCTNIRPTLRRAIEETLFPSQETITEVLVVDSLDIQKWYRRLALEFHPDRQKGSHEAMKAINRAYEVAIEMNKQSTTESPISW